MSSSSVTPRSEPRPLSTLGAVLVLSVSLGVPGAATATACLDTARAMGVSCDFETREEYYAELALCRNAEPADQWDCFLDADEARMETQEECEAVEEARNEFCVDTGEDRYDPDLDPADFETTFDNLNPYFPLAPGNMWVIESEDETVVIQVLSDTKLIDGLTSIVVNDLVTGDIEVEDTDDWYAQASNGDVWYMGEVSRDFEIFAGDVPPVPELVAIDGSFKAGVEGAEAGILMFANPIVGTIYRQEYALGEAEDIAEVLSVTYSYGDDPVLDAFVPQDLAELMCDGDCLVTKDINLHEPDEFEHKYYAPGIGLFLETKPQEGESTQLVECNLGGKCDLLP